MRLSTIASGPKQSYLVGAEGSGPLLAVDPGTEVAALLAAARGRPIERVILTSGFGYPPAVRAVQEATGASILAHRELCLHLEELGFEGLLPVSGGARFLLDETIPYRFLACPGVDPFAVALLVAETYLFTGESLYVGRPGRLDGPAADPRSLWMASRVLAGLSDGTQILAGRDVGGGARSTIGAERAHNAAFAATSYAAFVEAARAPVAPARGS